MGYEDPVKQRARQQKYYRGNLAKESARSTAKNRLKIAAVKALLLDHLGSHPCVDCGEGDPIVLEFDHIDPKLKLFTMAEARRGRQTVARVRDEMAKCVVRCANCHRRRTMRQALTGEIRFGVAIR